MKTIRIQIDMVFQVPDKSADEIYEHDMGFFYGVKQQFDRWGETEGEPRIPVKFDLRHDIMDTVDEEE